jgi:hypothetical protein
MDLTRGETRLLKSPQVRPERVRVQRQARGELADGDRSAREAKVAVEPIAGVVGERLVDLDRCWIGHERRLAV